MPFIVWTVLIALAGGACGAEVPSGRYSCVPGDAKECPDGWVCRTDAVDGNYRCFSTAGASYCGDGTQDPGEECDGRDLGGMSCVDLGYPTGVLHCASDCSFNTAGCIPSLCGNGVLEGDEECDGDSTDGRSCAELGGAAGTPSCDLACKWDPSECAVRSTCGDSVLDVGEACDGSDLGAHTCGAEGFAGGEISCNTNCTLNTSACTLPFCGDGVAQAALLTYEECDGDDLRGLTCADFGLTGTDLGCYADCRFDLSACAAPETCGNDLRQGFEQCDGADLGGQSCSSLGYASGALDCHPNCVWDFSGCR
jgi:hypothetical protein